MRNVNDIEERLPPIHPGEVLNEEFLLPMKVTQYRLAKAIGVDPRRILKKVGLVSQMSLPTYA